MPFLSRHLIITDTSSNDKTIYGIFHRDTAGKVSVFFPSLKKKIPVAGVSSYHLDLNKLYTVLGLNPESCYSDRYEG